MYCFGNLRRVQTRGIIHSDFLCCHGSLLRLGLDLKDCGALALSCVVLFTVSLLQENHVSMRDALAAKPLAARWCVYLMLLFSIPLLGQITMTGGGFIYAQF